MDTLAVKTKSSAERKRKWSKQQKLILLVLIIATIVAWVYTVYTSSDDMGGMVMDMGAGADPEMDAAMTQRLLDSAAAPTAPPFEMFVPMWVVMCIAMMLPTAIPMVYAYQALMHKKYKKTEAECLRGTILFIAGYILLWAVFGVVCWAAGALIFRLIGTWLAETAHMMLAVGILFVAAGIYQIGPLKEACLRGCRHPVMFLIQNWYDGPLGPLRIGMKHGAICVACCWALMVILFPLGVMNLLWMGLFTIIMYVEKNIKIGALISKIVGCLVLGAGVVMTVCGILFL